MQFIISQGPRGFSKRDEQRQLKPTCTIMLINELIVLDEHEDNKLMIANPRLLGSKGKLVERQQLNILFHYTIQTFYCIHLFYQRKIRR